MNDGSQSGGGHGGGAARDVILADIDRVSGQRSEQGDIAAQAQALLGLAGTGGPGVAIGNKTGVEDLIAAFAARVTGEKIGASLESVRTAADLPACVAAFIEQAAPGAPAAIQQTPSLLGLNWAAAGVDVANTVDDGVAVTAARWGIAETGSLVFHSAPDMPILMNFLPAIHIAVVWADTLVATLDDYAAAARAAGDPAPRNACLVTGASGTTDIEGRLVKGAHGPRLLHVIVVEAAQG